MRSGQRGDYRGVRPGRGDYRGVRSGRRGGTTGV